MSDASAEDRSSAVPCHHHARSQGQANGLLTLPREILRTLDAANKDTEFVLIQEGDRIVLLKSSGVDQALLGKIGGWKSLATTAFDDLLNNQDDEIWNTQ